MERAALPSGQVFVSDPKEDLRMTTTSYPCQKRQDQMNAIPTMFGKIGLTS